MKLFRFVTIVLLIFLVTGCDDFSIYSQFTRDKETEIVEAPGPGGTTDPTTPLDFTLSATTLTSGNSVDVFLVNGKQPFSLLKTDEDVYSSGAVSIDLGTFTETQYTAGKTCGIIKLTVVDSSGESVSNSVTVKPRPVEGLTVEKDQSGNNEHTLEWSYDADLLPYVEHFEILYSLDNSSYNHLAFIEPNAQNPLLYNDEIPRNSDVYYRVVVHAGNQQSQKRDVLSPKN